MTTLFSDKENNRFEILMCDGDFDKEPVNLLVRKISTGEIWRFWFYRKSLGRAYERYNYGKLSKSSLFYLKQEFMYK